ncbi:MAG: hypothetical protein LH645_13005 [Actinomycetia bacterium]|nr:hypothetical protein [Actinomycetes bacterium]
MSDELIHPTYIVLRGLAERARTGVTQRVRGAEPDSGVSTLEMVIIALGLVAVATLLVTAITVAVTRRTDQIK